MKMDDLDNYADMIPDGAMPICGFRLLSYMTDQGKIHYAFAQVGDVAVSQLVGLVDIVKTDLIVSALHASKGDEGNER